MSAADHEKELQRPRGAEGGGGLEGLAGPGARDLGSPEKKKPRRTSTAQVPPFPPSEYAPPPNPSADHLIAANPFDDNYHHHALPYKTLSSGSPYFASPPSYAGFGGFNAFRMPPHLLPRMVPSTVYGAAFPFRNQAHPFPQNPVGMVFSHPQAAMNFGPHENVGFGNQPSYNANVGQSVGFPGQHFRPNPGENFGHIPSQNTIQATPHHELPMHFGPGGNHNNPPHFNSSQVEANHSYGPPPNRYNQAKPLQQKQGATKPGATPQQQQQQHHPPQGPEDIVSSGNTDVKTLNRSTPTSQDNIPSKNMENLNSNHANGTQAKPRLPRGVAEGGGKMPLRPSHHDPLYPCGICTHEVNDDQDAILCEASCQKWFHRICTGMTESAYGLLTAEASAVWGCDACMADKDVQLMCTRETTGPPALNTDA
ncbi:pygopus homolog 1 [Sceloporus undulatus]|uniref:pygopus homolog 1 n=1 Tax=Sceloporus undulatus TaxID=8520 RepID=UPI001C4C8198|nr:pygopus homolog 1 [Sceloporus undulatus]